MTDKLIIRQFDAADIDCLYELIMKTIDKCYKDIYPANAVQFFKDYHSKDYIIYDCQRGYCLVLEHNGVIAGTGTLLNANIRRVFINPLYQGRGLGKTIMLKIEEKAVKNGLGYVELHASLYARRFYDSLGYITLKEGSTPVGDGQELKFFRMAKSLVKRSLPEWRLQGRRFVLGQNRDICFSFRQHDDIVYAEYSGGNVKAGEITGIVVGDAIEFSIEEENLDGKFIEGYGKGIIRIKEDGNIELAFEYESGIGRAGFVLNEIG